MSLSGTEFNEIYSNAKFYVFLDDNYKYWDIIHKIGLNENTLSFKTDGVYSHGGLSFYEESKCHFFASHEKIIGFVEVPNDALVYCGEHNFYADKIIITKFLDYKDVDDNFWINMVHNNGLLLKFVKQQNEEICKSAVNQEGFALQYVKNQTFEICRLAVQQNYEAICFADPQFLNQELQDVYVKKVEEIHKQREQDKRDLFRKMRGLC